MATEPTLEIGALVSESLLETKARAYAKKGVAPSRVRMSRAHYDALAAEVGPMMLCTKHHEPMFDGMTIEIVGEDAQVLDAREDATSVGDVVDASTKSPDILAYAAAAQNDRAQFYDAPNGERSMAKTVAAFNAITGLTMTEVQGWQFMELLKMVRSAQGKAKVDNFVDGASYASLAGEAALK